MSKFLTFDFPLELYIKVYFILCVEKNIRGTSQPTTVKTERICGSKIVGETKQTAY